MPDSFALPAHLVAALLQSLVAGFLFSFAVVVMPGLAHLQVRPSVEAFAAVDRAVSHPLFFAVFMGAPLACLVTGLGHLTTPGAVRVLVLAACLLSAATVVITGVVHLPINEAVQTVVDRGSSDPERWEAVRADLETRWAGWNVVRTLSATGAAGSLLVALAWRN